MNKCVRWQMSVIAGAIALVGSVATLDAQALGLGRITVQSSLGEPLRAEIDIAEISADEAASLRAGVASADAFRSAGLDYNLALSDLQISLQKRSDGRAYLRLNTNRPITEPFVDLILEANWTSGRIVRDYTMLFDPPSLRSGSAAAPVSPTAPILSRPYTPSPIAPSAVDARSIPYSSPRAPQTRSAPAPFAKAPPARAPAITAAPAIAPRASASGQRVAVKQGDTASKIASRSKPVSVSLDQMLVALLRSNPEAFSGGNINRLKSGAVLTIPTADEAAATSSGEASRTIVAQSNDFNDFRRKLAEGIPASQVASSTRQAGGKVEAKVDDRKPAAATPDKLTLSKGAIQGTAVAEDKIAKDRQSKEASNRVAELAKNIGELNKIAGAPAPSSATAQPASAASASKGPGVAVTKPAVVPALAVPAPVAVAPVLVAPVVVAPVVVAPVIVPPVAVAPLSAASAAKPVARPASAPVVAAVAVAASAPVIAAPAVPVASTSLASASAPVPASAVVAPASASSSTTAASASTAAAVAPVKQAAVARPPPQPPQPLPEPSLIDQLTDNPLVLAGIAGLLLLLAGLGFYRHKKRNKDAVQVDSSFLESRLQPDSFFGASGGQRVDTSEGGATGSSLVYSPSQLDAGDVDPVAEADVYLAYGRDLQAEEILKEAMRINPNRVAMHAKLAEIYAKRRDAKAFEVVAKEAYNLTRGEGPEWAYITEMGRDLDPSNPAYQPGGQPAQPNPGGARGGGFEAFSGQTMPQTIEPQHEVASTPVDVDLDLDFSLGDEPLTAPTLPQTPAPYTPQAVQTMAIKAMPHDPTFDGLDMDFSADAGSLNTVELKPSPVASRPADDLALAASGLSFTLDEPPVTSKPAPAPAVADSGMLEFDLGSLSLDLDNPPTESPITESQTLGAALSSDEDPLETKFLLAEEFRALGDKDGARSLADEVVAHATGSLKSKAQAFLNALA